MQGGGKFKMMVISKNSVHVPGNQFVQEPNAPPKNDKWRKRPFIAKRGHHGVRLLGVVVLIAAILASIWSPGCKNDFCPSYSLGNPWVLREERVVAVVVGLFILGVFFWRAFYHGQLPNKISKDVVEYVETVEVAKGAQESLEALDESVYPTLETVGQLKDDVAELSQAVIDEFSRIWRAIDAAKLNSKKKTKSRN
jgi:hypothetical protein